MPKFSRTSLAVTIALATPGAAWASLPQPSAATAVAQRIETGDHSAPIRTADSYATDLRPCQPGTHSESFPNQQGYRCVPNRR